MRPSVNPPPYSDNSQGENPYNPATGQSGYPMDDRPQIMVHPQTTTVIGATVIVSENLGQNPTPYFCKNCSQQIITRTEMKPTMKTHVCAGLLCFFLCWPCACIPYCVDSLKKTEHYCPSCSVFIGTYNV